MQLVKDIRKHQDIKPSSDEALTRNHSKLCSRIVKDFNDSKAQQLAGILDTTDGEYKDYLCGQEVLQRTFQMHLNQVLL